MSQGGSFQLIRSLKKSPAVFHLRLRRDRAEDLSHGDPVFKVHYLGTEKVYSLDLEQARSAVDQLLQQAPEKRCKDHALVVRPRYVEVKELSSGRQLTKTYLRDIASCAADTEHPNVFLYICKLHGQQLQCRVFLCSSAERAKEITTCLAHSFQTALDDLQSSSDAKVAQCDGAGRKRQSKIPNLHSKTSNPPADLRKGETALSLHRVG